MMHILFTKTGIENEVSEYLGTEFQCAFKDFIKIEKMNVDAFPLQNYSLIFSSANAVNAFFENGYQPKSHNKIYVVGSKTQKLLQEKGFSASDVFKNVNDLADFIAEEKKEEEFLHFCGNLNLDILEKTLTESHISYQKITVYQTQLLKPKVSENYDAVVFFSPSGVRSFAAFNSLEGKWLFSIGQTTENEIRKFTQNPVFTGKENSLEDLLHLIKRKADL